MIHPKNVDITFDNTRDPQVTAVFPGQPPGYVVTLYFEHAGRNAPCVGFDVTRDDPHEPGLAGPEFARIGRDLPHYVRFAHAYMAINREDAVDALDELRRANSTDPRGRPDPWYQGIVAEYRALVDASDPAPQKTMAQRHGVHHSQPSRWLATARARGIEGA